MASDVAGFIIIISLKKEKEKKKTKTLANNMESEATRKTLFSGQVVFWEINKVLLDEHANISCKLHNLSQLSGCIK